VRSRQIAFTALVLAAVCVVLIPTVRVQSGAADAACSVRAYVMNPAPISVPPYSIPFPATAAPTPVVRGTGTERTLTVTGRADVAHAPDTAYVDVRLTTSGPDAQSASCANERAYDALRARLGPMPVVGISTYPSMQAPTTYLAHATPPPAGTSPQPASSPGWFSHRYLRLQTTPARWRDAVAAVEAVHGTVTTVQFALNDLVAVHELAAGPAMRDALATAGEAARSEHAALGPLLRVEAAEVLRNATSTPMPVGTAIASGGNAPEPVRVRASVTATFALGTAARADRPVAALIVVHPLGFASGPLAFANLAASFSDQGNDRAALLYRHESAYDALWAKLRALGITAAQVPNSSPGVAENRPAPSASPGPTFAYRLYREVHVNGVPIATLQQVVGAFTGTGATTADVTFVVSDRTPIVVAASADVRRNGSAEARAIASAAGFRLADEPYVQMIGYPQAQVSIYRTQIGSADHPTIFEPPAAIEGWQRANIVYAATR
jgi:uncharacterized protein YggE